MQVKTWVVSKLVDKFWGHYQHRSGVINDLEDATFELRQLLTILTRRK
jgi:hypothetical protein